jgi:hypothetical protein
MVSIQTPDVDVFESGAKTYHTAKSVLDSAAFSLSNNVPGAAAPKSRRLRKKKTRVSAKGNGPPESLIPFPFLNICPIISKLDNPVENLMAWQGIFQIGAKIPHSFKLDTLSRFNLL